MSKRRSYGEVAHSEIVMKRPRTVERSAVALLDERIKLVPPINPLPTLEAALKDARALDFERGSAEAGQIVALAQAGCSR